jgi:serine/threonine-protein kinase
MAEPTPRAADRNLLFGILALQMDFISRDALMGGMNAWVLDKGRPLAQVLLAQGALSQEQFAVLEPLVEAHVRQHGGDPARSLAALRSAGVVRADLGQVADPDVQASLDHLAAHQEGTDPQATVAGDTPRSPGPNPSIAVPGLAGVPTAAGVRFRVLRPHARGGLGQVSVALDQGLRREVALKEIQVRYADDPDSRARFLREAEVTGRLEHPSIVPVYWLGNYADGRPFYAMRLIQGNSLTEAIARFHQADGPGRDPGERALALRELLGRFVGVCQAVAYAHSRGVIHRDLKPANVMLGPYGETLVVDWGLAKTLGAPEGGSAAAAGVPQPTAGDGPEPTQLGAVLGTPAYMAPEQAAGRPDQVGPAADVYGLGATLYCLLTGQASFERGERAEVLQRVQAGDFPRPRTRKRQVPPALEAVCLKAMARRPEDRYAGAAELAQEVQRWLADEPVHAYPEPLPQRAARWARRHRTLVASAAVLLLTAVAALAVGLLALNAERQRTQAALEAEARRRQQARQALDAMTSQVIEDWLARQQELTPEQRQFLEEALASYEDFARDTGQDEPARAGVAQAHFRVGVIQASLGRSREAEAAYRHSQQLYAQLAADFPGRPEFRQDLARSQHHLGNLLAATGRAQGAEAAYRAAQALYRQLAADFPGRPDYRHHLARSHNGLGLLLADTGRPREAEAAYGEALAQQQQLVADFPGRPEFRQDLARSQNNLGRLLAGTGRTPQAKAAYGAALGLYKQLAADFPRRPDYRLELATSHHNLGLLLVKSGQPHEAEAAYRDALGLYKQLAADFPSLPDFRKHLANNNNSLGGLLVVTGRPKEAEAAYGDALALHKQLAADFPDRPDYRQMLAGGFQNLGFLLSNSHRPKEAEKAYRDALTLQKPLVADFPGRPDYRHELAKSHANLGLLLERTGRPQEAEAAYRAAQALYRQLAADIPDRPDYRQQLATSHINLGALHAETGRPKEAEAAFREALALHKQLTAAFPDRPDYRHALAVGHVNLGNLLAATARPKEAEAAYRDGLALARQLAADFPPNPDYQNDLAAGMVNLAQLLRQRGELGPARRLLEESLPHHQAALRADPRHPSYRGVYRLNRMVHAETLLALGRHAEAAAAAEQLLQAAVNPMADAYDAGCYLARCVPLAQKDGQLPPARQQELVKSYGDRALAALRQAVRHGYRDAAHMKRDADLDPLRERADFQALVREVESGTGTRPAPGK